jgi:hypothetical protein
MSAIYTKLGILDILASDCPVQTYIGHEFWPTLIPLKKIKSPCHLPFLELLSNDPESHFVEILFYVTMDSELTFVLVPKRNHSKHRSLPKPGIHNLMESISFNGSKIVNEPK